MSSEPRGLRVLIVDDEHVITDSLVMILRIHGYAAYGVYSAEVAILIAAEVQPQALISDVVMDGMSGIDLALDFAVRLPECKVLLMSGNVAAGELMEESLQRGCQLYEILPKPVPPAEILAFVASCDSTF